MSEQQQYIGERWTQESIKILTALGWTQINDSGYDIPCSFKNRHGSNGKIRSNPHGIDISFICLDPFLNKNEIIIVESKTRQWNGITVSSLESFLKQLLYTLECSNCCNSFNGYDYDTMNTGLLMIWCNEPLQYNPEEFIKKLKKVKISATNKFLKLYVASNYEILKYCSLIKTIEEIKSKPNCQEFKIFYPSDTFGNYNSLPNRRDIINLSYMFSKFIFARSKEIEKMGKITTEIDITHIFFFEEPTREELNFISTKFGNYQLEDCQKIIIHFYGKKEEAFRNDLNFFKNSMNKKYIDNDKNLEIEYNYMPVFKEVPTNLGGFNND